VHVICHDKRERPLKHQMGRLSLETLPTTFNQIESSPSIAGNLLRVTSPGRDTIRQVLSYHHQLT
jgi:hypothetical protein